MRKVHMAEKEEHSSPQAPAAGLRPRREAVALAGIRNEEKRGASILRVMHQQQTSASAALLAPISFPAKLEVGQMKWKERERDHAEHMHMRHAPHHGSVVKRD
jgi:hypothetical protein